MYLLMAIRAAYLYYAVEQDRQEDFQRMVNQKILEAEAQSKLHIQNLIKEDKLELVSSYTVDYELSKNPFEMRKESIRTFIEENATEYRGVTFMA